MMYLLKVIGRGDEVAAITIEADSTAAATERARADGYVVLGVARQRLSQFVPARGSRRFSTLLFSQELLALLVAGLSLIEALEALKSRRQHEGTAAIIEGIVKALSTGKPLSTALAAYPQHFSSLYVASIQASERTGHLVEALSRLVQYQRQIDDIRKKIVAAATYPTVITGVAALVTLFLLLYVVPRFSKIYESFSGELPFFSKLLIGFGGFVSAHGTLIMVMLAVLAAAIAMAFRLSSVRGSPGAWLRRLPILADNLRLYELSRLYRTLGMLLAGGVPITRALAMATPLLPRDGRRQLENASRLISEGAAISTALDDSGMTTPVALRMLSVGERTGEMGPMMERIAAFYEEDLTRWIETFSRLAEPLLMLALGLVVGAIVVVMYMPIFELATAIR